MGSTGGHAPDVHTPEPIYTVDELFRQRGTGSETDQTSLVAFPKSKFGVDDFEFFTGREINRLVDGAVSQYLKCGLNPTAKDVVAIVGHSDLDFVVNVFALGRLGYTALILSPRLDDIASLELLQDLGAVAFIYGPLFAQKATYIHEKSGLKTVSLISRDAFGAADANSSYQLRRSYHGPSETLKNCIIMHSSGSTGKPRPIFYPHKRLLHVMVNAQDLIAFLSVPLFHAHGLVSFLQAIYKRKTVYLFNGNVPQTHDTVTAAIKVARPELVWTVPYVLKLLAEKPDGIDVLKECQIVSCSGSRCPDELGDLFVRQGVHLGTTFGATEVAFVFSNLNRPKADQFWDYMSAPPHVAPFVHMKPIDENIFELVVLDGHKGKVMSNSNDPPNSFHTKDLFTPHWELKGRWKYIGRLDDRITLSNGEKFIPLDIEGRVRQNPLVKEAVVFGIDRPLPGLLIFRSAAADNLSDKQLLDALWPKIREANARVSAYGHIGREYIAVLPASTECPSTDKQSVKRSQVYRQFSDVIERVYMDNTVESNDLKLSLVEMEDWLVQTLQNEIGVVLHGKETDFFAAGVDSQKAMQMRRIIIQSLDLGDTGSSLSSLVVFEHPNVIRLSGFLYALRANGKVCKQDDTETVKELIKKYSSFPHFSPGQGQPEHATILLTGATGTLGTAILYELLVGQSSSQIYCPVRAKSDEEASSRLTSALSKFRHSFHEPLPLSIHAFPCDLASFPSSVSKDILDHFASHLTHVIHAAWPVNFSLGIASFEPHLSSLKSLYNLTTTVATAMPARFLFCSSVGVAMNSRSMKRANISDGPVEDLCQAAPTGYARSKLVAEKILEAAHSVNQNSTILRIGQILPSTNKGSSKLWNPAETIPLIIESSLRIAALPLTPGPRAGDECSWIPVNILAGTAVDLAGLPNPSNLSLAARQDRFGTHLHYNLVNPVPFSWSQDFLPLLVPLLQHHYHLTIETLPFTAWLDKLSLKLLETQGEKNETNPSFRLVDIWSHDMKEISFQQEEECRTDESGNNHDHLDQIKFETDAAFRDSQTFRQTDWNICTKDYVDAIVSAWMKAWERTGRPVTA